MNTVWKSYVTLKLCLCLDPSGGDNATSFLLWRGDVAARQLPGQLHEAGRDGRAHRQGEVRPARAENGLHPRDHRAEEARTGEGGVVARSTRNRVLEELHRNLLRDRGESTKQDSGGDDHKGKEIYHMIFGGST